MRKGGTLRRMALGGKGGQAEVAIVIIIALGLLVALVVSPGDSKRPASFVQTMEPSWARVEVHEGMSYDRAWASVVHLLARRFDLEVISKEGSYVRTTWLYSWTGEVREDYRVRVILKFSSDRSKVDIKSEANYLRGGNWIAGSDTALLKTLKTDIMGEDAMEHVRLDESPPQVWRERYRRCPCVTQTLPSRMGMEEIREEIGTILFDEGFWKKCGAADRELLTIVIVKEKAGLFDFLKAYTTWSVTGLWEEERDLNVQINCEFRDNPQECLGNRLMHLLYEYNKAVVREEVLYARTSPIEEGTLFP